MSQNLRKFVNAFAAGASFMVALIGFKANSGPTFLVGGLMTGFNTFLYTLKDPNEPQ